MTKQEEGKQIPELKTVKTYASWLFASNSALHPKGKLQVSPLVTKVLWNLCLPQILTRRLHLAYAINLQKGLKPMVCDSPRATPY